ncbi:MAG: nucleoside-diphosphate sugar epimerase/dehydratase [Legionellaceae bacterium]|nr:nucleoside-diphosphate sugar epimerase/dehydratase [Legionellaceae bacterium]
MDRKVFFFQNSLQKFYTKLPVVLFDILAIPLAWCCANAFQFNSRGLFQDWLLHSASKPFVVLLLIQVACYYAFKVYRGLWRFSSLGDMARILKAVCVGTLLAYPVFYTLSWLQTMPRTVLPLYGLLLMACLCGARLTLRYRWDKQGKLLDADEAAIQRVVIVGAGNAGESLVRDLQRTHEYVPIGLVDDDKKKCGLEVHGVRVLGSIPELSELVIQCEADLIFIALPSAGSAAMRRIVNYCETSRVPFRTLPSLQALVSGRVEVNALRTVNIGDLLGRDQVELEWNKIEAGLHGRCVLVTGGGGSIGSELCRQIAALQPEHLVLFDNSESNLYHIELELRAQFPKLSLHMILASVVDVVAVNEVFERFKPHVVFHAAAYKHVPMLEEQVRVAVYNNVIGTQVVVEASLAVNAEKFVLISTDKAVNPTNIMGTTKRIAEIYCQNLNQRVSTQFITVRFGNVLGSVGSVVPLFQKQLEVGGPLTVTHPDVKRYFMTIPEASQLILQAMVNGEGGEIFMLDMGEPITITYLAEQMIRLAGKKPGQDIEIKYTGLRPGEKLFEELFHASEPLVQTTHEKLFKARFREINWDELTQALRMMQHACHTYQTDELMVLIKSLVPEFSSELSENA